MYVYIKIYNLGAIFNMMIPALNVQRVSLAYSKSLNSQKKKFHSPNKTYIYFPRKQLIWGIFIK